MVHDYELRYGTVICVFVDAQVEDTGGYRCIVPEVDQSRYAYFTVVGKS